MRGSAVVINVLFNIVPAIWTSDQGSYFLYSQGEKIPLFIAIFFFFILFLAAIVLVLWIAMPLSIFTMKKLLKECVAEQKKTNTLIKKMMEAEQSRVIQERDLPEIRPIKDEPRDF
ncbi:MAG: hypothetical protein ACE5EZ_02460 [Thermodesulfobacteriota bacterium]